MLRARKRAEASHIVVVNHSLLLSDIAVGGHVIPLYQRLIVDEAHHLEDEATRQFGFTCSRRELLSLLERSENIAPTLQASMSDSPVMLQLGSKWLVSPQQSGRRLASPGPP
jgi:Rad3-related DNA helicase